MIEKNQFSDYFLNTYLALLVYFRFQIQLTSPSNYAFTDPDFLRNSFLVKSSPYFDGAQHMLFKGETS